MNIKTAIKIITDENREEGENPISYFKNKDEFKVYFKNEEYFIFKEPVTDQQIIHAASIAKIPKLSLDIPKIDIDMSDVRVKKINPIQVEDKTPEDPIWLYKRKDIQGNNYIVHQLKTDFGRLDFYGGEGGYVLFDLEAEGDVSDIKTYFGLNKEQVQAFARKLLDIVD